MQKKKKVIFYAAYLSEANSSAASVRCSFLIKGLRDAGYNVQAWTHQKVSGGRQLWSGLPSNKNGFFIRFCKEVLAGTELVTRLFLIKPFSKDALVILSSPPYVSCLIAAWACRRLRIKYFLDIRDLYPEAYFFQGLIREKSIFGRFQKYLAFKFYSGASHIFAVSHGLVKAIRGYNIDEERLTFLPNGFDAEIFRPSEEKFSEFTCVVHGTLGWMQDVVGLKRLATELLKYDPGIRILVIGSGPQEHILRTDMPKNILYLGKIPYQFIPEKIGKAHLGISMRRSGVIGETALPVKIFEYLGVGIPAISVPIGEAGDFLISKQIGWQFDAGREEDVARLVLRLKSDRAEYQAYCSRVNAVRKCFSRQQSLQTLLNRVPRT